MMHHTAVGTPGTVRAQREGVRRYADADGLILVHHATSLPDRLRSVHLLAGAYADARGTA